MKTSKIMIITVLLLLPALAVFAQSEASGVDYFAGKWKVLVEGTPQGDVTMIIDLHREDSELVGNISAEDGSDTTKIDRISETEESITVYWFAQGHNVNIKLNIKDENHMAGSLMSMFNSTADRVE